MNYQDCLQAYKSLCHKPLITGKPNLLYAPINYIMEQEGKKIRPVLCLMAHQLFNNNINYAFEVAYAIELFHNFSLVHDDVMDEAPIRRGETSVHHKFGVNNAILSGDVMLAYCYKLLEKYLDKHPNVYSIFSDNAIKVCEGQSFDMAFETKANVTIEEYINMISLKTSVLLGASLQIGALLANASKTNQINLYEFGKNIGIAFQLMDDYLDAFADTAKFGKKVGGDIAQNKQTFLLITAKNLAPSKTQLLMNISDENEKIEQVKQLYIALDIPKLCKAEMTKYQEKAFKHLNQVNCPNSKQHLTSLANKLFTRVK